MSEFSVEPAPLPNTGTEQTSRFRFDRLFDVR